MLRSAAILYLGLLLVQDTAEAQRPRFVVFEAPVRERLAEEWQPNNRWQREKAWCLAVRKESSRDVDIYRVYAIQRAEERDATPFSVRVKCPEWTGAIAHLHPPTVCHDAEGNNCELGGDFAYQCQSSPKDRSFLFWSMREFDVVVCGPQQYVPFFRDGRL